MFVPGIVIQDTTSGLIFFRTSKSMTVCFVWACSSLRSCNSSTETLFLCTLPFSPPFFVRESRTLSLFVWRIRSSYTLCCCAPVQISPLKPVNPVVRQIIARTAAACRSPRPNTSSHISLPDYSSSLLPETATNRDTAIPAPIKNSHMAGLV